MAVVNKPAESFNRIEFGDGQIATLIDSNELVSEDVVEFKFIPTRMMSYAMKIPDDDRSKIDWSITRRYKREYCYLANSTPGNTTWKLFCDYHERPTNMFEYVNKKILAERDTYKAMLKALTRVNSRYKTELIQLGRHIGSFKDSTIKDIERLAKVVQPPPYQPQPAQQQTEGEDDLGN